VNTPGDNGVSPVFTAAQKGDVCTIRALAEHGADVNSGRNRSTPVFRAAQEGHVEAIRALVVLRADFDARVLTAAVSNGHVLASSFLVNIGAGVKHCLLDLDDPAADDHVREMVTQLWGSVAGLVRNSGGDINVVENWMYSMFSLTKLMSSPLLDGDEADSNKLNFEMNIATSMRDLLSNVVIVRLQAMRYVVKRRLVRIAWTVYQSSLLLDGDRVTVSVKARRYLEVVCLLFDLRMLRDVAALRMTCKSNSDGDGRRRFPVIFGHYYQELPENMIEEWVGYASSRFVSTDIIFAVIAICPTY
jgi:hypothetical protein